jgi:nitrogen fixation protein NifM
MPDPLPLPSLAYLELKTAQSLHGKLPADLGAEEREQVARLARNQFTLEARVLRAPEARDVTVPPATVQDALAEIRGRFDNDEDYAADLARMGLTPVAYADALERELRVEAILDKVASRAAQVSDIDVELYYHYHPEQFHRPETRRARHILITVQADMPDNTPEAARARIEAIAARLAKDPKRFEEQAAKHSECPTALQGGLLGEVKRGQLYPELDDALFRLPEGSLSPILHSPMGYHLVLCEAVQGEKTLALAQVRERIREQLEQRRRRVCQQAWIKTLPVAA